jgi:predicted deacylase
MGAEAIRRFIEAARRSELKGKVYAAPLANLLALRERRPHVGMKPEEPYGEARHRGTDMLHAWLGRENGNDIERVAFAIHEAFLRESTHVLDLHTHERCQAANVVVRDTPALRELAGKLGHRFVDAYSFEQAMSGKEHHILLTYADAQGKTSVLYNGAGQYVVSEPETTRMTRVVANFAKAIGLMAGPLEKGDDPVLFSDRTRSVRVTAPVAGLFVEKDLKLYDFIEQGALLGHILAEQDLWRHEVRSPRSGYLREYGASRAHSDVALPGSHPYVSEGDRLAKITWPT